MKSRRGRRSRVFGVGAGLLAAALAVTPAEAQAPKSESTFPFRMGYSAETISDAGSEEAAVVTGALVERIAKRTLGVSRPEARAFQDFDGLAAALRAGQLDVVVVTADEYARLAPDFDLDPALTAVRKESDSFSIGVVVRRASGITSLEGLRGLAVLRSKDQSRLIQSVWLETELMRSSLGDGNFFSSIKETRTPSQAIMSVFFGQAAACVVSIPTFEIAAEMNPQLTEQLLVVARSADFSRGIVAFRGDYPKAARDRVYETMLHLHEDPEGQQIMRVFRHEKMVPFRPQLLESSRSLMADYKRLLAIQARKDSLVKGAPR